MFADKSVCGERDTHLYTRLSRLLDRRRSGIGMTISVSLDKRLQYSLDLIEPLEDLEQKDEVCRRGVRQGDMHLCSLCTGGTATLTNNGSIGALSDRAVQGDPVIINNGTMLRAQPPSRHPRRTRSAPQSFARRELNEGRKGCAGLDIGQHGHDAV